MKFEPYFDNIWIEKCLFGRSTPPAAAYWSLDLNRQCVPCRGRRARQLCLAPTTVHREHAHCCRCQSRRKSKFFFFTGRYSCQILEHSFMCCACKLLPFECCRQKNGKRSYTRQTKVRSSWDWSHHRGHKRETSASTRKKTRTSGKKGWKWEPLPYLEQGSSSCFLFRHHHQVFWHQKEKLEVRWSWGVQWRRSSSHQEQHGYSGEGGEHRSIRLLYAISPTPECQ